MARITELWINSDYLKMIWPDLDPGQITVRAEFDEETRDKIKALFQEIHKLKQIQTDDDKKKGNPNSTN